MFYYNYNLNNIIKIWMMQWVMREGECIMGNKSESPCSLLTGIVDRLHGIPSGDRARQAKVFVFPIT